MKKTLLLVTTILMFSQVFSITPIFGTSVIGVSLETYSNTIILSPVVSEATNEINKYNLNTVSSIPNNSSSEFSELGCGISCVELFSGVILDLLSNLCIHDASLYDFRTLTVSELTVILSNFAEYEGYSDKTFNEGLAILANSINSSDLTTITIQGEISNLLQSSEISPEEATIISNLNSCLSTEATNNGQPTDATISELLLEFLGVLSDYVVKQHIGPLTIDEGLSEVNTYAIENDYSNATVFDLFNYILTLDVTIITNDGDRAILNRILSCITSTCESLPSSNNAGNDNRIIVCEGSTVDLNTLTTASGGVFSYSGVGLNGSNFNTSGLAKGNYDIIYTVSNGGNCPDDKATITVSVIEDNVEKVCKVIDANYCRTDGFGYNFYWEEMQNANAPPSFSSDETHKFTFTTFKDKTALITGSTLLGDCVMNVHVVLKEKKNWTDWNAGGGGFKVEGCSGAVKENLSYYVIDAEKSFALALGGDCLGQGKFKISQRPDPNDPNTPSYGAHVGPGAALNDSNVDAEGLAAWGWMGPEGDERKWKIDFNFLLDCEEKTCTPTEALHCETSCVEKYSDSVIGLLLGLTINNNTLSDISTMTVSELIVTLKDLATAEGYNNNTFNEGIEILRESIYNSDLSTLTIEAGIADLLASSNIDAQDAVLLGNLNACFSTVASSNDLPTNPTIGNLILECLEVLSDYLDREGFGNFPINTGLNILNNQAAANGFDSFTLIDLFGYLLTLEVDLSSNDRVILNSILSCISSSCESISSSNDAGEDNSIEICEGETVDLNSLTTVSGGAFSYGGINLADSNFNTTGLSGDYQITYTVSNGGSCPDDTAIIKVTIIKDLIEKVCNVIDADYCLPGGKPLYNFYWEEMQNGNLIPSFSSDATHKLKFTTYNDGTALISGSTRLESCFIEVYVVLKNKKDWTTWNASGGNFKVEGCSQAVKEDLSYYVIDADKSFAIAVGGDCLDQGQFKISQRPDPNDPNTPHYGAHVGPGAALNDSNVGAEGLAAWGWMGPEDDLRKWKIDFNFLLDCEDKVGCSPAKPLESKIGQQTVNESDRDANDGSATVLASGGKAPYSYLWDNGETTMTAIRLSSGIHYVTVTDANRNVSQSNVLIKANYVGKVSIKVILGGSYNTSSRLMNTYLNTNNLIPAQSPYSDGISTNPLVFDITGADAIVDWVWIEIRDVNKTNVIDSKSALIQADGDIVGIDGKLPLSFKIINEGDHHVMISHRNHLGIITANPVNLNYSSPETVIDLTGDINLIHGLLNGASITTDNRVALYSGDCDGNGQIQNTDKVEAQVLIGTGGLLDADLDMNGQVQNSDIQNNLIPNIGKGFQNTQGKSSVSSKNSISGSGSSSLKSTNKTENVNLKLFAKRKK